LLAVAAVVGPEFSGATLVQVAGADEDAVDSVLMEAETARLIVEVTGALDRYRFAHALVRETLYAEVPLRRRLRLHDEIGAALEALYARNLEAHLAEIAWHYSTAASAGTAASAETAAKAAEFARRAGDHAMKALAFEEAAQHYETALQMHALLAAEPARRCELLLALAEAQHGAGEAEKRRESCLAATEAARESGVPELFAKAVFRFTYSTFADSPFNAQRIALLDEALGRLPETDAAMRVEVLAALAQSLFWTADRARGDLMSRDAVAIGRRVGEPHALAQALYFRHGYIHASGPDTLTERLALAHELMQLAHLAGGIEPVVAAYRLHILVLYEAGDVEAAARDVQAYATLAEQQRLPALRWHADIYRAMQALNTGPLSKAEQLIHAAYEHGKGVDPSGAPIAFLLQLYSLRRLQGRGAEALPHLEAFIGAQPQIVALRALRAVILCEAGRLAAADAELTALAAHEFAEIRYDGGWLAAMCLLARLAAAVGNRAAGALLEARLLPQRGRIASLGDAWALLPPVTHFTALLAALREDYAAADADFTAAEELERRLDAQTLRVRTQAEHARMLLRRNAAGDRRLAQDLLGGASAVAARLGMQLPALSVAVSLSG
jgi:hypothetical protein